MEALKIYKKVLGDDHPDYASTLSSLSFVYREFGMYAQAEPIALQAVEILKKNYDENHPQYLFGLYNLAGMYAANKDLEGGEPLYLGLMEKFGRIYGKDHPYYAYVIHGLASLYKFTGKHDKAAAYYEQSVKLSVASLGEDHPENATTILALGDVYMEQGNYQKAEETLFKAKDIVVKSLGQRDPLYCDVLNTIADNYMRQSKYEEAKDYLEQAIVVNLKDESIDRLTWDKSIQELSNKDYYYSSMMIRSIRNAYHIGRHLYDKGQKREDLEFGYTALNVLMDYFDKQRNKMTHEEDKLSSLEGTTRMAEEAIRTGKELFDLGDNAMLANTFRFAELNKSMLLMDAIKGKKAKVVTDIPDTLVRYELELQQAFKNLEKEEAHAEGDSSLAIVKKHQADLALKKELFLKQLKEDYPKYYELKYQNITVKVEELQEHLKEGELLLEYFIGSKRSFLFAVSKDALKLYEVPIAKDALSAKIKIFRRGLANYKFIVKEQDRAYQLFSQNAAEFYNILLKSALTEAAAKNIQKLIVITDGELGHLPFEVLLVEPAPQGTSSYKDLHYLLNDYEVSYDYSATLLVNIKKHLKERKPARYAGQIFAVGGSYPSMIYWDKMPDKDSLELSKYRHWNSVELRKKMIPLSEAGNEIAMLSELFRGEFNYASSDKEEPKLRDFSQKSSCSEAHFKVNAHQYGIIHLAMHGLLHPRVPILSSLAFTENLDSLEDNFLQAYEIAHLHLNADLVVLSACETGYGKFLQGEGVVSLARSFMYAGVPSVVVSLWQVNDHSTAMIMKTFYEELSKGSTKDIALKKAKLEYLSKAQGIAGHPAFWSAFILIGDTGSIDIAKKGVLSLWLIAGGIVLLLGVFFVWKRSKLPVA